MIERKVAVIVYCLLLIAPVSIMSMQVQTVQANSENNWINLADMTYSRQYATIESVCGKIYVIGGRSERGDGDLGARYNYNEEYNIITNSWSIKSNMPESRDAMWSGVANGVIYIIGGYPYTVCSTVRAYYPSNNSWSGKLAYKPNGGWDGAAVTVVDPVGKEVIYCLGGSTDTNVKTWNEVYCPNNNTWLIKTSMNKGRAKFAASLHENKIYVFGSGWASQHNKAEYYDLKTDSWHNIADLPWQGFVLSLGQKSINGKIYLLKGGENPEIWYYDPAYDTYTKTNVVPINGNYPLAGVEVNRIVYIAGGGDYPVPAKASKKLKAFAPNGFFTLTLKSMPTNVNFIITGYDSVSNTSACITLTQNTYQIKIDPCFIRDNKVWSFSYWNDTYSMNPTRVINLESNSCVLARYRVVFISRYEQSLKIFLLIWKAAHGWT